MLESRKNYYGFDATMYKISDHLWISNLMPNAQHLVNQFNIDALKIFVNYIFEILLKSFLPATTSFRLL
ncbi:hypothetical protein GMB34_04560 [Turicibacter sanguinis]|uniref:hypothetical protein n=1 Tax=Turicibacter sanguinis TaxID=154288 RepID=UPI0012BC2C46|nr:hypothetical protein [Turicibacter sanguinis]MCU7197764.1 hypothetical protein [Turicibacter sanguinis]MDB8437990.1 hypothetical protein [Turicibacter sanguinis]MTN80266.1 hypothetical protein [Turicibacter sanguinis]MTN83139.1 hypothetical protein [Turicibacter sanguinis]MTN86083.1 hypothetical protein [Turicibacter sanguinis]